MRPPLLFLLATLLACPAALSAAELTIRTPVDYQVVQRATPAKGVVRIAGELSEDLPPGETVTEARVVDEGRESAWKRAGGTAAGRKIAGSLEAPAGGWRRLEVRVMQ